MEVLVVLLFVAALALLILPICLLVAASAARRRADTLEARLVVLEHSRTTLEDSLRRAHATLAELRAERAAAGPAVPGASGAPMPERPEPAPAIAAPDSLLQDAVPHGDAAPVVIAGADAGPSEPSVPGAADPLRAPSVPGAPTAAAPVPVPPVAVPPASVPQTPDSPEPPFAPKPDWERWVGVRGAAVLGGGVLALAAVLFFRYAVEHGLLPPLVRVVMGSLLGVGCVLGAERLRARYEITANALAGAGLVALYAAFWAARVSYDLIGMELCFALMALTTAAGCLLALRHASLLIAVLALAGGFATPLLLSSGSDRPIGLFGYILLLDAGFVVVARRRGWSVLFALALAGTLLIEALWIGLRMGPERAALGAAVVALFAALFGLAGAKPAGAEGRQAGDRGWRQTRAAAVVLSFGYALHFASQARLGVHLAPIAALLGVLSFGAAWLARREARLGWLPYAAAAACTAVVVVWCQRAALTPALSWEAALCSAGLGLVFQLAAELSRGQREAFEVAALAQLGLLLAVLGAAVLGPVPELWGWLTGSLLLVGALARTGQRVRRGHPMVSSGALLGLGLIAFQAAHASSPALLGRVRFFEIELAVGVAFSVLSLVRRSAADHALAAVFPGAVLLGLCVAGPGSGFAGTSPSLAFLGGLGVLAAFALTRAGDARWLGASTVLLVVAQHRAHGAPEGNALAPLAILALTAAFAAGWPLVVLRGLRHRRWAAYTSALAGPLWFLDLREAWLRAFGPSLIGLLPLTLGALSLLALRHVRCSLSFDPEARRSGIAGHAAVALGFASVAIPLQLDRQWITLGWALESAAVLLLFRRVDHAGLKWFGLGLAAAVTVRLVFNPSVLEYEVRGWPVLNWLLYTYWVPALALLGGRAALRDVELGRARPWEAGLYASRQPLGALALGGAAIAVLFVWLNLAIFDAFAEGTTLLVDLERQPARDLTISLGWALYAGVLSSLGILKGSRGLRWVSLGVWLLTVVKVFLYDLDRLRDLYRVLSLLGLAVSLIAISLAYQRFVFNGKSRKEST